MIKPKNKTSFLIGFSVYIAVVAVFCIKSNPHFDVFETYKIPAPVRQPQALPVYFPESRGRPQASAATSQYRGESNRNGEVEIAQLPSKLKKEWQVAQIGRAHV